MGQASIATDSCAEEGKGEVGTTDIPHVQTWCHFPRTRETPFSCTRACQDLASAGTSYCEAGRNHHMRAGEPLDTCKGPKSQLYLLENLSSFRQVKTWPLYKPLKDISSTVLQAIWSLASYFPSQERLKFHYYTASLHRTQGPLPASTSRAALNCS